MEGIGPMLASVADHPARGMTERAYLIGQDMTRGVKHGILTKPTGSERPIPNQS